MAQKMAAEWDNLITDSKGMPMNGSFDANTEFAEASAKTAKSKKKIQPGKQKSITVKKKGLSPASSEQSLLSEEQEEYVVTEYIMEYTDIFEPSKPKVDFIDIQEGDEIYAASDEEIVAHSGELNTYEDLPEKKQESESEDESSATEANIGETPENNEDSMTDNGVTEETDEHNGSVPEEKEERVVGEEIELNVVSEGERNGLNSDDIESQDEISLSQETENEVEEEKTQDEERDSDDDEIIEEKIQIEENEDDHEDETSEVDKLIENKPEVNSDKKKSRHKKSEVRTQSEEQPLLNASPISTSPEPSPSTPPMKAKNDSFRTKTSTPSSQIKSSPASSRTKPSPASTQTKISSPNSKARKSFPSKAYPGKVVKSVSGTNEQDISNSSINRTKTSSAQIGRDTEERNKRSGRVVRINENTTISNKTGLSKHHTRENEERRTSSKHQTSKAMEHSSDANFFRQRLPQTSKRPPKRHVWLCRDSEIHRLIAEKAAILRRYKQEGVTGRNRLKDKGFPNYSEVDVLGLPSVGFSGKIKDDSHRSSLPYSKHPSSRSSQSYLSRGGSSSEDEDEVTNRLGVKGGKPSGTFAVGLASRRDKQRNKQQDHENDQHLSDDSADGCELCAAEAREKEKHEKKLKELEAAAKAGPHHPRNLMLGIVYSAKFLGSTNLMSPTAPNKAVRLQQAQEAIGRIKVPEGEEQPSSDVDLFISTERIKVVSAEHKQTLLDHHLKTISFIADIGNIIVVMARLSTENDTKTWTGKMPDFTSQNAEKKAKVVCHVLETNEAQTIAKTVGQAFSIAYHEFLKVNQLNLDEIEDAEYNGILEQQKILGEELSLLADETKTKEVVIHKKYGESLSLMIVESGWGSMIPTVVIAHLDNKGPAAKSGQLNVGNQILAVNGQSLVGLPLLDCQNIIRGMKYEERVALKVVCCPPTVEISVNRPDTKYQLGFSVQNGMICSLMRGGIAERGGVRVGHKIIELNGESVVAASHHYIVDILQTKIGELRMKTMPITLYKLLVGLEIPQYL